MHSAPATVPHQYTKIVSVSKSIMYLILSTGSWCHEATLQERGSHLSRTRVPPLTSKITSNRFLNAHFHIHLDFIFSDVKDTSLCFQTYAVSFSLAVWCVRSHAGDPETPFDFPLNIIIVIFSKWLKCSVLGPRWWWWSRHRTVSHAALCMWNCICCQRAGLSHERSKQTKSFTFPSVRLVVKECDRVFCTGRQEKMLFLDVKRISEPKLGYFLSWTRRP